MIGFLHEDVSKLQAKFVEQSSSARRKLESFRQLLGTKLCKFYNSPSDLGAKVSRSITQLREQSPAIGWIRADALPAADRIDEILRLKEENERLTEHIYRLGLQEPDTLASLASGQEKFEIEYFFNRMEENPETKTFQRADIHQDQITMTWDEIFAIVGPSLIAPDGTWSIPSVLLPAIEQRVLHKLRRRWAKARFQRFLISSSDADAILLQLRALKLITVNGEGVWGLTPYGDNYMAKLLAVPKGQTRRR